MSLVYLVTSLPPLRLGTPPPLARDEYVRRCRGHLEGADRDELERALLLEEIEETCRLSAEMREKHPDIASGELVSLLRTERRRTSEGPPSSELPDWVMMPLPQHVLFRRYYAMLYETAKTDCLRGWARFSTDLKEVLTGLVSAHEKMPKSAFLRQMEGHFESAAGVIIGHYESAGLGVEGRFPWFAKVKAAVELDDLIAMERAIDELRWLELERLKGSALFSLDFVLGTYFQLRILERQASWDEEAGKALLDDALRLPEGLGLQRTTA